jgi:hypothetical protein
MERALVKYGHLWLTKRDKTCIMTKLLFLLFFPYLLLLLLLLYFIFIEVLKFLSIFFPQKIIFSHIYIRKKKIQKLPNFLVEERSKIHHNQWFKIMPIF